MDSPLLPTHRNRPFSHSTSNYSRDDPSLLADLSIEDDDYAGGDDSFLPSSPIRPISRNATFAPLAQGSGPSSSSRTTSASSFAPKRQVSISAEPDADDNPQKPQPGPGGGKATSKPRFSLFAPPRPPSAEIPELSSQSHRTAPGEPDEEQDEGDSRRDDEGEGDGEEDGEDETIHAKAGPSRPSAQASVGDREDRLRESLYELRRMNEVFEVFLSGLEASRGHNERLAIRVKQTSALLDDYTAFLGQAEHTQKLLSNPNWTGAHDDAAAIEAEHLAQVQAEEARLREAEEAAEAAQRAEEERERNAAEAERAKEAGRGGAPARGRGGVRGGTARGRGSGIPTSSRIGTGAKTPTTGIRKPTAPSGTTGGGGGSAGTGTGKYGYVASSGYGPPGRKS